MQLTIMQYRVLNEIVKGNGMLQFRLRDTAMPIKSAAAEALAGMGLIWRNKGRGTHAWQATSAGRALIEPPPVVDQGVYVPPKPLPVRAGAYQYARVPSVYGGRVQP